MTSKIALGLLLAGCATVAQAGAPLKGIGVSLGKNSAHATEQKQAASQASSAQPANPAPKPRPFDAARVRAHSNSANN